MQDERNTPQDEDVEEVEAHQHNPAPVEEPGRNALEDEDEVEAHQHNPAPPEQHNP